MNSLKFKLIIPFIENYSALYAFSFTCLYSTYAAHYATAKSLEEKKLKEQTNWCWFIDTSLCSLLFFISVGCGYIIDVMD